MTLELDARRGARSSLRRRPTTRTVDSWVARSTSAQALSETSRAAGHRLDDAAAVAHLQEGDLAARALVGNPAAQRTRSPSCSGNREIETSIGDSVIRRGSYRQL